MDDRVSIDFRPKDIFRFMRKVRVQGPESCWLWKGRGGRYGNVFMQGRHFKAHRVAYLMMRGPIRRGLLIRHTCDTKGCVNPAHLLLGTAKDNAADLMNRGRAGRPPMLSEDQCIELHRRYEARACTAQEFAEAEGVSRRTLHRYLRMARERLSGVSWDNLSVSRSIQEAA